MKSSKRFASRAAVTKEVTGHFMSSSAGRNKGMSGDPFVTINLMDENDWFFLLRMSPTEALNLAEDLRKNAEFVLESIPGDKD